MSTAAPFAYRTADSWEAAVEELVSWGEEGKILAGGQSLVPMLNLRLAMPEALIDVNPIPTPEPAVDGDTLVLPALTRHRVLLRSPLVKELAAVAREAAAGISPESDVHAGAAYRRRLTEVLVRRTLAEAIQRAGDR